MTNPKTDNAEFCPKCKKPYPENAAQDYCHCTRVIGNVTMTHPKTDKDVENMKCRYCENPTINETDICRPCEGRLHAVAQLWCKPKHSGKEMDVNLAEDILLMVNDAHAAGRAEADAEVERLLAALGCTERGYCNEENLCPSCTALKAHRDGAYPPAQEGEVKRLRKYLQKIINRDCGQDCECCPHHSLYATQALNHPAQEGEVEEYEDIAYRFSCLLDYATGGVLSKTNYTKEVMYEMVGQHIQNMCNDHVEDLIECGELCAAITPAQEGEDK